MPEANDKIPALRHLGTGAITKLTKHNKNLAKRKDMVQITVDEEGKQTSGPESTQHALVSGDLRAVVRALHNIEDQRTNLIKAAVQLKDGAETLVTQGLVDEEDVKAFESANTVSVDELGSESEDGSEDDEGVSDADLTDML